MNLEILSAYKPDYPDPIRFEAGDSIEVSHPDPKNPVWFWCRATSGKEGWVHESFLTTTEGVAIATENYTARELNVSSGETGILLRELAGWYFLRLGNGDEGWLPQSHARFLPDEVSDF